MIIYEEGKYYSLNDGSKNRIGRYINNEFINSTDEFDMDKSDIHDIYQEGFLVDENTPKDRKILAYCDHERDPYQDPDIPSKLTSYGSYCEWLEHADRDFHIVEWRSGYWEGNELEGEPIAYYPGWWFLADGDDAIVANPVVWWPLPEKPV